MPKKQVAGVETYYQQIGNGPVILLLHGWRNSWQSWSNLIPFLSEKYQLVVVDLPGFGKSANPKHGWGTPQFKNWLQALIAELQIAKLEAVIGHSYGGKVAAWSWLVQPNLNIKPAKGLFLIGPSGIPPRLSISKKMLKNFLPFFPSFVKRQVFGFLRPWLYNRLETNADYLQATTFQQQTLAQILDEDIRHSQNKFSQNTNTNLPIHLCFGEQDEASPLWMAYEWLQLSNQSEIFVVEQAGHFPHHSHPQLIQSWLETYLA